VLIYLESAFDSIGLAGSGTSSGLTFVRGLTSVFGTMDKNGTRSPNEQDHFKKSNWLGFSLPFTTGIPFYLLH
jgi:hypothetical protein